MKIEVNNGQRLPAIFGSFRGNVGVARKDGKTEIAFLGDWENASKLRQGTLDGVRVCVIAASRRPEKVAGRDFISLIVEEVADD